MKGNIRKKFIINNTVPEAGLFQSRIPHPREERMIKEVTGILLLHPIAHTHCLVKHKTNQGQIAE